jgi:hypothetical protein
VAHKLLFVVLLDVGASEHEELHMHGSSHMVHEIVDIMLADP